MLPIILALLTFIAPHFTLSATQDKPKTLHVVVTVLAGTRAAEATLVSDDYFRTSAFEISESRTRYELDWRGIPEGEYALQASALDEHGTLTQSNVVRLFLR